MKKLITATALAALMTAPALAEPLIMYNEGKTANVEYEYDMTAAERLKTPAVEVEGYQTFTPDRYAEFTPDMLDDADVYGLNGEEIGEIEDLVLTADGKIMGAVLEVGGFLGMGEREVMVPFERLQITGRDGLFTDLRVYIDSTEEALEALPEFEADY